MRAVTAQLPDPEHSDDRVVITDHAAVMLDGASAFLPVPVPARVYADRLGRYIRDFLDTDPQQELRALLAAAIQRTARDFDLVPGSSPSSTVTIIRESGDPPGNLDILVLGDNLVVLPDHIMTDDRLDRVAEHEHRTYQARLATGAGYDIEHYALIKQLQTRQAQMRNRPDGYWIAEADPHAAYQAVTVRRPLDATPWVILATDGAYGTMQHLGLDDWSSLATRAMQNEDALTDVLRQCQSWEAKNDPTGRELPRAKRHDDKSLAVLSF